MMQQPPSYQTDNIPDDPTLQGQPVENIADAEIVQSAQDAPIAPTPQAARSARAARRLPVARIVGAGFILIVVLVLVVIAGLQINSAQRQTAYNIDPYPNAVLREKREISKNSDEMVYATTDGLEVVAKHYRDRMGTFNANNDNGCSPVYLYATDVPGVPTPTGDAVPTPLETYHRCVVNNSFLNNTQITVVTIRYDVGAQRTIITVQRDWGAS
jgi:hypothetical protein